MRTLTQPGPASEPRRVVSPATGGGDLRVDLPAGVDLLEGLVAALTARGVEDAAVEWVSAEFSTFSYLTGQPDESGLRVATYGPPTLLDGPVRLIGGNAILGRDATGAPLIHCHAIVVDAQGEIHGGHLPPGTCELGSSGAVAMVAVLRGAGFSVRPDAETNFDIFQPTEVE